jgi:hypothetical protein
MTDGGAKQSEVAADKYELRILRYRSANGSRKRPHSDACSIRTLKALRLSGVRLRFASRGTFRTGVAGSCPSRRACIAVRTLQPRLSHPSVWQCR